MNNISILPLLAFQKIRQPKNRMTDFEINEIAENSTPLCNERKKHIRDYCNMAY